METNIYDNHLAKMTENNGGPGHPLHDILTGRVMERCGRLRPPVIRTDRHALSFVHQAILLQNKHFKHTSQSCLYCIGAVCLL